MLAFMLTERLTLAQGHLAEGRTKEAYAEMLALLQGPNPLQDASGMSDLKFNPADAGHSIEQRVYFEIDGSIASIDAEFHKQLSDMLGLNLPVLQNRRKAVIDGLVGWLREYRTRHHRGPDVATLQRMRDQRVPSSRQLEPFVYVAVWWLDRRLDRSAA